MPKKERSVWNIDIQVFVIVNVKYTNKVLQYQIDCLNKLMLYSYREAEKSCQALVYFILIQSVCL